MTDSLSVALLPENPHRLRACALCTRPDGPLPDNGTKAVPIERNCIFKVGHAVRQANVHWIRAHGDKHRVPLPSQRFQNPSLSTNEVSQISRPLEIEEASIQLQDTDRGNDKIFRTLRNKRFLVLQPIEPARLLSVTLDHLDSHNDAGRWALSRRIYIYKPLRLVFVGTRRISSVATASSGRLFPSARHKIRAPSMLATAVKATDLARSGGTFSLISRPASSATHD